MHPIRIAHSARSNGSDSFAQASHRVCWQMASSLKGDVIAAATWNVSASKENLTNKVEERSFTRHLIDTLRTITNLNIRLIFLQELHPRWATKLDKMLEEDEFGLNHMKWTAAGRTVAYKGYSV